MQSLCTLRHRCRQRSRNTRYQAGAAPYLHRTSTGWIAPACLAHSLDHLVGLGEEVGGDCCAERFGGIETDDKGELARQIEGNVARLDAFEDLGDRVSSMEICVSNISLV